MPETESFADFMRRALFDPGRGYYTRNISAVGSRGDFSTAASVSGRLGRAVARWILAEARALPDVRTVIEVGGGDGSLMAAVRNEIGWINRRRYRFCMVEKSAPLREKQQQLLGKRIAWFDHLAAALDGSQGRAFIYHNELLDAQPVALVEWDQPSRSWHEVWLQAGQDGRVVEERRPLQSYGHLVKSCSVLRDWTSSTPPPSSHQRCELHIGIREWLSEWMSNWKSGAMLSIDYGDLFPSVYHRRPLGTLRAYLLHHRLEGPEVYQNAGRQDITADVNFTDLRGWLIDEGCVETLYMAQHEFLKLHGKEASKMNTADRFVSDPAGAGTAFKCLAVRRIETGCGAIGSVLAQQPDSK